MANFNWAYKNLAGYEGGYVNDVHDMGGETVCGIARKYWPNWCGWELVDTLKAQKKEVNKELAEGSELVEMVEEFYKTNYWEPIKGDKIESQPVANELLEQAVHMGITVAVCHLQTTLNVVYDVVQKNAGEDVLIAIDGIFGSKTLGRLKKLLHRGLEKFIVNYLNGLQFIYYNNHYNRRYLRGWLKRVEINKTLEVSSGEDNII